MKMNSETFFTTILPALVTLIGFFIPALTYPLKIIVPLTFATLYFIGLGIVLQSKLNKVHVESSTLGSEIDQLKQEKAYLKGKLDSHSAFIYKRELFIKHDLTELCDLLSEYEVYVRDTYRAQKQKGLRDEAGRVKRRALHIINKEKRDFDEQLYDIQGD